MVIDGDATIRVLLESGAWHSTISFAQNTNVTLGGVLDLEFASGSDIAGQLGKTFDLFDWTGVSPVGTFSVESPYAWDLTRLYTTGEITLLSVPEPDSAQIAIFLSIISCGSLHWIRRRRLWR